MIHSVEKNNEADTATEKDDVEKKELKGLLDKIPQLNKSYDIHRKIGEGTFSSVYLGSLRREATLPCHHKQWFAVKHLVPTTHPTRVAHELRCLKEIGGKDNVIGVLECLRHNDNVVFIMPYIKHNKFSEYVSDMGTDELRLYMRALLTALRHVHSFGVIHRDVKPSNFLYDRERRRFALVDFGLAQDIVGESLQPPPAHKKRSREDYSLVPYAKRLAREGPGVTRLPGNMELAHILRQHMPGVGGGVAACACAGLAGVCAACAERAAPRANRAGTQGFRPPEVFLKYQEQSTAVDMWACGVILLSLLTGRYPFFKAEDDLSALGEIIALFGRQAMETTAIKLGCRFVSSYLNGGTCLRKLCAHLREPGRKDGTCPPPGTCCQCRLRNIPCLCPVDGTAPHETDPERTYAGYPDSVFSLLYRLLDPSPRTRITAADALAHPFIMQPCSNEDS